jgi:hypothetical protein
MKIDADEKELLESVDRGEWKSAWGGKRERTPTADMRRLRSARTPAEYPAVEKRPGDDPEAVQNPPPWPM